VDSDRFLTGLMRLYEGARDKGSVSVTMKRSAMINKRSRKARAQEGEYQCLVRATDGKKKLSTLISEKEQVKFQTAYMTVLKASMDALKKRTRAKRTKKGAKRA